MKAFILYLLLILIGLTITKAPLFRTKRINGIMIEYQLDDTVVIEYPIIL